LNSLIDAGGCGRTRLDDYARAAAAVSARRVKTRIIALR
jgi:hypothetical protein